MAHKIVTLRDKDQEAVIPIGVGKTNCNAEWFTVKLDKASDDSTKTFTTRNGGKYTFKCNNGGTGWTITSTNRTINIYRARTEFRATGGSELGIHDVKAGTTVWTRVYGDYKEGTGAQSKRQGNYTVASGTNYCTVLVMGNPANHYSGRLNYTMMRERSGGGWRGFFDFGSGYNVNWNSLDVELIAENETVAPCFYIRGVNNSNIADSFTVIDILEEL